MMQCPAWLNISLPAVDVKMVGLWAALFLVGIAPRAWAQWPTLHGNPQRTGRVESGPRQLALAWTATFTGERLGSAMEPIVAEGHVFVATHSGNLYALEAAAGNPRWRFQANGPFLHSPAVHGKQVIAADAAGWVYALDVTSGKLRWASRAGGPGGFAASPLILGHAIFIGSRQGVFQNLDLSSGKRRWHQLLGVPIRQSAAAGDNAVYVTGEDLRVRAFMVNSGKLLWESPPLSGQTARDYYPILVAGAGKRARLVVRTNPILGMAQQIQRDRQFLCRQAGIDDRDWRTVDAWTKSGAARGTPELWDQEQIALTQYLVTNPVAQSFYVFDAQTGSVQDPAPVLWIGGCQGVGVMPAVTREGSLVCFYRSAYGNWNHGVAPLVALGELDLEQNRIEPWFHRHGSQPPWNTFWGTADEAQNFVVAGDRVYVVHQGTLSTFSPAERELTRVWGNRDTFGGGRNPAWARNEWHGPARGAVAVTSERVYWITGSQLLCLAQPELIPRTNQWSIARAEVSAMVAPRNERPADQQLHRRLAAAAEEILDADWAPAFVDPGLAGRHFNFDNSGVLFEMLAWAYPELPDRLQQRVRQRLDREWREHPPWTPQAWYLLDEGKPREWFHVPDPLRVRSAADKRYHPFGNLYATYRYAARCGQWDKLRAAWPSLRACFADFQKTQWRLDGAKGDRFANRYLSSLLACERIARRFDDAETAAEAGQLLVTNKAAVVQWWERAAQQATRRAFNGSAELDPFITQGDALSLRLAPHRHQLALFHDLNPDLGRELRPAVRQAAMEVWRLFQAQQATWWVVGEERQVHFGENFVDPPELAWGAFNVLAWLAGSEGPELAARIDLPFCRADLSHLAKIAIVLENRRMRK
jgi:hypothetical protein